MAKNSLPTKKLASIVLVVAGAGLAFWGYQKSEGLGSQLSSAFTGSQSDSVMMLYIAGAVCIAVGFFLMSKK